MGWTSTPMAGGGRGAGADHVSANTLPTNLIMMKVCLDGETGDSDCWSSYEFLISHSSGCSSAGLSSSHPHTPTAKNKGGQVRYIPFQGPGYCLLLSWFQDSGDCLLLSWFKGDNLMFCLTGWKPSCPWSRRAFFVHMSLTHSLLKRQLCFDVDLNSKSNVEC